MSLDLMGQGFTGQEMHGTSRNEMGVMKDCTGRYVKTIVHGIGIVQSTQNVANH